MKALLCLFFAFTSVLGQIQVSLPSGEVIGSVSSSTGVRSFLGVPFAAPPVGPLRWKSPQPVQPWSTPLHATTNPHGCASTFATAGTASEDCLYLNIFSPDGASALPVMVWIHGGTFQSGSASQIPFNNAAQIVTTSGNQVVVVVIQYRLNAYGFLASELLRPLSSDGSVGTYGFLDQQAALSWVKNNIAAFGGDAGRVTLFGESAGATSISTHLVAPGSAGLFQQVIIESGALSDWNAQPMSSSEQHFASFVKNSPCASTATANLVNCLYGLTTQQIDAAVGAFTPGTPANLPIIWEPVVDGVSIPASPAILAKNGNWSNLVPMIIGTNTNEGAGFVYPAVPIQATPTQANSWLNFAFGNIVGPVASGFYDWSAYPSPFWVAENIFTDSQFICPTRRTARYVSGATVPNPPPVYVYYFTHTPAVGSAQIQYFGAYHGSEMQFVFDFTPALIGPGEPQLAINMVRYWTNFAIYGNPNSAGIPTWPRYDATSDQNIVLDTTISTLSGLRTQQCQFWDAIDNLMTIAGPTSCDGFQVFNLSSPSAASFSVHGSKKCACSIFLV